jgi:hypothetical protein
MVLGGQANNMGGINGGSVVNMSAVNQSIPNGNSAMPRGAQDQNGDQMVSGSFH